MFYTISENYMYLTIRIAKVRMKSIAGEKDQMCKIKQNINRIK